MCGHRGDEAADDEAVVEAVEVFEGNDLR